MRTRSISGPIITGSTTVAVAVLMLVVWVFWTASEHSIRPSLTLAIGGSLALLWIGIVLVLFQVFLVREILEQRRQATFLASVTHELRSPLASLKLCLDTMERPELPPEKLEPLRNMMRRDVARLSGFIEDVLTATRMNAGGRSLQLREVDIATRLEPMCREIARLHGRADDLTLDLTSLHVNADQGALDTILRNLVDNAFKYSSAGDEVAVTSRADGRYTAVEVRDDGIGMSWPERRRATHRFFRGEREEVRSRKGTGLGLFVARGLARELGGRLELASAGPNQGCTARLLLPEVA